MPKKGNPSFKQIVKAIEDILAANGIFPPKKEVENFTYILLTDAQNVLSLGARKEIFYEEGNREVFSSSFSVTIFNHIPIFLGFNRK